jgi:hypothetical protein
MKERTENLVRPDKLRVLELLEEMMSSGRTPELVCADIQELLPEIRRQLARFARVREEFGRIVPPIRTRKLAAEPGMRAN